MLCALGNSASYFSLLVWSIGRRPNGVDLAADVFAVALQISLWVLTSIIVVLDIFFTFYQVFVTLIFVWYFGTGIGEPS